MHSNSNCPVFLKYLTELVKNCLVSRLCDRSNIWFYCIGFHKICESMSNLVSVKLWKVYVLKTSEPTLLHYYFPAGFILVILELADFHFKSYIHIHIRMQGSSHKKVIKEEVQDVLIGWIYENSFLLNKENSLVKIYHRVSYYSVLDTTKN